MGLQYNGIQNNWNTFLLLLLTIIFAATQPVYSDTIANAYATTNASILVEVHTLPYVSKTFFYTNYTQYDAFANYNFTDSASNFSTGAIYVPKSIVLPYPYCALTPYYEMTTTPANCSGGLLLYGYRSIGPVPNMATFINGATDVYIEGASVPALDTGSLQSRGTITWLAPSSCSLSHNPGFELQLGINGLTDVNDVVPVTVTDSASNLALSAVTYGLGCSNVPRPIGSTAIDAMASMIPICRNYVPYNTSIYNTPIYTTMFGAGYIGPSNVAIDAVVYQLRVDNLANNLRVYTHVKFVYPDNTVQDLTPLYIGYDDVMYIVSNGHLPALVYVCFYGDGCTPVLKWNEVLLGYLQPCNCAVTTSQNLPCNGTTSVVLNTGLPRASIPNFPPTLPFVDAPTCLFYVNSANNGSNPVVGVPFQVQSGSTGGVGQIYYQWQFSNLPSLAGSIQAPGNTQTITAVVNVATTVNLTLTVYNLNGVARSCWQNIVVNSGVPVACLTPTEATNVPVGASITLDATCSYSPKHLILTYAWFVGFQPSPGAGVVIPPTAVATAFTGSLPGVYIILLVISDGEQTASVSSKIVVINAVPPPSTPSSSPSAPVAPPYSCFVPAPQVAVPTGPPQIAPPLNIIPQPPGVSPPPPSSPAYFPPSNIATLSNTSIVWLIIGACVLLAVLLCSSFACEWTPQRNVNGRTWFTSSNTTV